MPRQPPTVAARIEEARGRLAAAAARSGRPASAVRLLAVSKTVPVARIREALAAGVTDLGENRVQEAAEKQVELAAHGDLTWHLTGHLQTNKAARAAQLFSVLHSVDSLRVAAALAQRRPANSPPLRIFIEAELTGIPARTGVPLTGLAALIGAVATMPTLHLAGLMTMAPPTPSPEGARPYFAHLRRVRDEMEQLLGLSLPGLSMGMSADYEVAIEEGATIVRLGRALFGY